MLRPFAASVLLVLAACDDAPPPATLTAVPEVFVGLWDVSLADCGSGGGPQAVTVSTDQVLFNDSVLDVSGASPDGDTAVRVDGHFTTEMAEWNGSVRLELGDGGVLNVVNGSALVPRVKCP